MVVVAAVAGLLLLLLLRRRHRLESAADAAAVVLRGKGDGLAALVLGATTTAVLPFCFCCHVVRLSKESRMHAAGSLVFCDGYEIEERGARTHSRLRAPPLLVRRRRRAAMPYAARTAQTGTEVQRHKLLIVLRMFV
jgi:hypothetical protein